MLGEKKLPGNVNVTLSLQHIKRFFDALPSSILTGELAEKKENAQAGLDYLDYFFDGNTEGVMVASSCGPRAKIPDLP